MRSNARLALPLFTAALLLPLGALAEVGTVDAIEGAATRTPKGGTAAPLKVGDEVELEDTLEVDAQGNLKVTLVDNSVLMLAGGSKLRLDEARFKGSEREAFSARLLFGSLWAKVTKALAGSDSKFEVSTERAVAGVRGTVFEVDIGSGPEDEMQVAVEEGEVEVVERQVLALNSVPTPADPMRAVAMAKRAPSAAETEASAASGAGAAPVPQARPPEVRRERIRAGEALRVKRGAMQRHKRLMRAGAFARFIGSHRHKEREVPKRILRERIRERQRRR